MEKNYKDVRTYGNKVNMNKMPKLTYLNFYYHNFYIIFNFLV